jgi:hypothetical protein
VRRPTRKSHRLTVPSGKIPKTRSVGSIGYPNFGVFAIAEIATENAYAVPPMHLVTRMPISAQSSL